MAFLPGNRLLCYTGIAFILHDLHDASTTTTLPSQYQQQLSTRSSCPAQLPIGAHAISQPYLVHNSTRFTFLTMDCVKGFAFPDSGDYKLEPIELFQGDFLGPLRCMGYHDAVSIRWWPTIIILQYAWPEERPYSTWSMHTLQKVKHATSSVLIDSSSGRVIFWDGDQQCLLICDLCPESPWAPFGWM